MKASSLDIPLKTRPINATFFLGLQISELCKGIFNSQTKYVKEMLKKFNMEDLKPMCICMIIGCKLRKEDEAKEVD